MEPAEAQEVLSLLLAAHPELRAEAQRLAHALLADVQFEAVADDVEWALESCDLGDLHLRAGRREGSYVEPTEAAWEILEEALEPFNADMKRLVQAGQASAAVDVCHGIVLGLYRFAHGDGGELAEWAPDFPIEAAGESIGTLVRARRTRKAAGRERPAFPPGFVDRHVPEWREMIRGALPRSPPR